MKRLLTLFTVLSVLLLAVSSMAAEDRHYIQPDDYFISDQPFENNSWIYARLAKMVTPPTAATKNEAEFLVIRDGVQLWSQHYWKTVIATPADLKIGTVIILFEGNSQSDVYQAPATKESARGDSWFMAKITDVSDLYKGYVTTSGGYKAAKDGIRIVAPSLLDTITQLGKVTLYITFDTGKDVIKDESQAVIKQISEMLNADPALRIAIEGHTDSTGDPDGNQRLSDMRASSVKAALVQSGINASRLEARGYGRTKPIADNSTEEGRAKNRRVELVKL